MTVYQVYDGQTQKIIGNYSTRSRASLKRDKLDNEYGAYRYHVRTVTVPL